jgi:glycosyltransferase involved in cell wall biosynthesis
MGGVESHCEQLYPRVKALRPDFDITLIGRNGYIPAKAYDYGGVRVKALPALRSKALEAISNTFLAVLYARCVVKARVVHIHGIGPGLVAPLARLLGMKVVCTYHSKNFEHQKWGWFARLALRAGERCALVWSNRLISVSRSVTEELKARYPKRRAKIVYIPNGAPDFAAYADRGDDSELLKGFGVAAGGYIVAVGRLVPEKAFHTLLAAYKKAAPAQKLVIVGKADHEDAYSRDLLAQASERIVFAGFQSQAVLCKLYRNASLFVLPSVNEGLPISALEAMSLEVPVLLSDIQPNLDIDLPPRNHFRTGDVADLAEKLAQDHARYRVEAGPILRRFDWRAISEATRDVFAAL